MYHLKIHKDCLSEFLETAVMDPKSFVKIAKLIQDTL